MVHLHLHTQYSLLDGAIRPKDLAKRLKDLGMSAVAMTDHGNMFGAVTFYKTMKEANIKPILGCETYVAGPLGMKDRTERVAYHLVLLAKDNEGLRNLIQLTSMAYLEGFHYKPRIDKELLASHSKGLIGLSACLSGEIPRAILSENMDKARALAAEYRDIFDKGAFYLELQDNGITEQGRVNEGLIALSRELGIPLVATNDCHYLDRTDAKAHEILMCIQTGKTLKDQDRMRHDTDAFYLKSPEEMERAFSHVPEALRATLEIAEACNTTLELGKVHLPTCPIPDGHSQESYLKELATQGLQARLNGAMRSAYQDRLCNELAIINKMGFPGYFLIVHDLIHFARQNGIPVGPGRGSGAGSLVAYSLGITDLDPLRYGLLFERFLNPERVSMPDIDIDFCKARRAEIIGYIRERYGRDCVGQIITFGSLQPRAAIRDVGRVLGLTFQETDRISKLIPEEPGISLDEALKREPRLSALASKKPRVQEVLDVARSLEGLFRQSGTHASGVVIGEKPLISYAPLCKGKDDELATQFDKDDVEAVGLVKFDILGLKTLSVINEAMAFIRRTRPSFVIEKIPIDDAPTFTLLACGVTTGVFQLESSGFKALLRKLRPDCFEDIIAAVALYRPGPLGSGMVDDFVRRKHGEVAVSYPHPWLQEVLQETYGVIVYQEQVMQIASRLAGFSLGQADLLRRAMGKKKPEVMAKQKEVFLKGAKERDIPEAEASSIFDLMAHFAGYGFNKSHSAAYALISYRTAYLKAHYPLEYMTALLSGEMGNPDRLVGYMAEARSIGLKILPPDINSSERAFTVEKGVIRVGLGAIKGAGEKAIGAILKERENGPFRGLHDLCTRVNGSKANKRVLTALIHSGVLDGTGHNRAVLVAALDEALKRRKAKKQAAQASEYPIAAPWPRKERLAREKGSLGFYVTGHPLDPHKADIQRLGTMTTETMGEVRNGSRVTICGIVAAYEQRVSKKGMPYGSGTLEDLHGQVELLAFSEACAKYGTLMASEEPVIVQGRARVEGDGEGRSVKILVEKMGSLKP